MKFNNKTYDVMKWVVMTVMPALAVFISTVGKALNWEYTELSVTLLNALTMFLGASLGLSSANYHRDGGEING